MEICLPSSRLLEAIDFDGECSNRKYKLEASVNDQNILEHIERVSYRMMGFYNKHRIDIREEGKIISDVRFVAIEGLLNARDYGCSGNPFFHILVIGKNGVCQGFYDQGDYYKRPDVKTRLEGKIPEVGEEDIYKIHGRGILYFFAKSDIREVDNDNGILWTGHLIRKNK